MSTLQQFNAELAAWPDKVMRENAAPMQRNVLTELAQGLIDGTPVADRRYKRSGHAKSGWRVDLFRSYQAIEREGVDPTGVTAKTEAASTIARIQDKPVPFATISNPVEYIDELANGSSKQAPAGWVERTIATVSAKYARVR